ncbi:arabinose efflux permease family protein [Mycobacteroides abscessus subsp. abscessus]|nr:arabinose efflux permease family protein [Mycobacteroides abscessus subsp. abscessus]
MAGATSAVTALLIAAALLAGSAVSSVWLPIRHNAEDLDLTPTAFWPEPQLVVEPDPDDGPVMVLRSYDVPAERVPDFLDVGVVDRYVEAFVVRSWAEHMHQHQVRLTAQDRLREQAVAEFGTGEPSISHLVAVDPHRR